MIIGTEKSNIIIECSICKNEIPKKTDYFINQLVKFGEIRCQKICKNCAKELTK